MSVPRYTGVIMLAHSASAPVQTVSQLGTAALIVCEALVQYSMQHSKFRSVLRCLYEGKETYQ